MPSTPSSSDCQDDGVEGDIILADEVVNLGFGVVPPIFPCVRLTDILGPFPRWQKNIRSPHRTTRTVFLVSQPSSGTSTPQSISRVMGRPCSPSMMKLRLEAPPRSPASATRAYSDTRSVSGSKRARSRRNARSRARSACPTDCLCYAG